MQGRAAPIWAIIYFYVFGSLSFQLMPFWVGAVSRVWDPAPHMLGLLVSVQLAGGALASVCVSLLARDRGIRQMFIVGALFVILGNLYSLALFLMTPDAAIFQLALARFLSGCGEGGVLSVINLVIARTANPHKLFSLSFMTFAGFGAVTFLTVPPLIEAAEASGLAGTIPIFLMMVVFALPAMAIAAYVRWPNTPVQHDGSVPVDTRTSANDRPFRYAAYLPVFAVSLLFAGFVSIHGFIERIAASGGLSTVELGYIKAAGVAFTILGPTAAGIIGTRFGHMKPMVVGLAMIIFADITLGMSSSLFDGRTFIAVYSVSLLTHEMLSLFIVVYAVALIATLDGSGRLSAAFPAFQNFGASIGPFVGGLFIGIWGYPSLGWLSSSLYALFLVLLVFVLRKSKADHTGTMPASEQVQCG